LQQSAEVDQGGARLATRNVSEVEAGLLATG
jgi:hypothetical protein